MLLSVPKIFRVLLCLSLLCAGTNSGASLLEKNVANISPVIELLPAARLSGNFTADSQPAMWINVQVVPDEKSVIDCQGSSSCLLKAVEQNPIPAATSSADFLKAGGKLLFVIYVPVLTAIAVIVVYDIGLVSLAMAVGAYLLSTWGGITLAITGATAVIASLAMMHWTGAGQRLLSNSAPYPVWFTVMAAKKLMGWSVSGGRLLVQWGLNAYLDIFSALLWYLSEGSVHLLSRQRNSG